MESADTPELAHRAGPPQEQGLAKRDAALEITGKASALCRRPAHRQDRRIQHGSSVRIPYTAFACGPRALTCRDFADAPPDHPPTFGTVQRKRSATDAGDRL